MHHVGGRGHHVGAGEVLERDRRRRALVAHRVRCQYQRLALIALPVQARDAVLAGRQDGSGVPQDSRAVGQAEDW